MGMDLRGQVWKTLNDILNALKKSMSGRTASPKIAISTPPPPPTLRRSNWSQQTHSNLYIMS